ncbi:UNVERIFIED_CONTAM: hypothetical protein NCL1_25279 [Trichonephila clavipes]
MHILCVFDVTFVQALFAMNCLRVCWTLTGNLREKYGTKQSLSKASVGYQDFLFLKIANNSVKILSLILLTREIKRDWNLEKLNSMIKFKWKLNFALFLLFLTYPPSWTSTHCLWEDFDNNEFHNGNYRQLRPFFVRDSSPSRSKAKTVHSRALFLVYRVLCKQIRKEEHVVARPYIATIGLDEIDIETSTEQSAEA